MKSTQCFKKLIFLWLAIIFLPIWMSKQHNRKWWNSLPSSEGSSFWNQFHFACVFPRQQELSLWNTGLIPRVAWAQLWGTRASFHGMECVKLWWTGIKKIRLAVYDSYIPLNLKQGQCHQIKSDNVDPEQGYNHAQFERSHLNGDRKKADVNFFMRKYYIISL